MKTIDNLKPNDILFTKDGRQCGNMLIIDVEYDWYYTRADGKEMGPYVKLTAVSDYGNIVNWKLSRDYILNTFYKKTRAAGPTHKHYNYRQKFPEEFL